VLSRKIAKLETELIDLRDVEDEYEMETLNIYHENSIREKKLELSRP
jgi:hypothetical protein